MLNSALLGTIGILASVQAMQDGTGRQANEMPQEGATRADAGQQDEIVVTGRRIEAVIPAESEFDEDDIAADGSDTIQELLINLQPFIDPGGAQPILLINGKRAGFDTSILSYPVGALVKVAVLKQEAGSRYGARNGARVVNLVLKPKFASLEAEVGVNGATKGGQYGGSVGATRTAINGDTRWNLRVQLGRQGALLKSARTIARSTGTSNSAAPAGNGDAALEQYALNASPGISADIGDFETLQPATRNVAVDLTVARPLGSFAASVTLNASRSSSQGLVGLAKATPELLIDSGWSPDEVTALLSRSPFTGRALRNTSDTSILGGALALTGPVRGVQTSLLANVSNSESEGRIEIGYDVDRLRQLIHAENPGGMPNPFSGGSLLSTKHSHSRSNNLVLSLNLQKAVLKLPAGSLSWSLSATTSRGGGQIAEGNGAALTSTGSKYALSVGQLSVSVPISARESEFAALGDLTIDLSLGRQSAAGGSADTSFGGGLTWAPFSQVQIRGSVDKARNAPSFDQLNGPLLTTVDRIFDYSRGEFADPARTTGGNPLLKPGGQTAISLSMMVKPVSRSALALDLSYRHFVATGSPSTFPELTPAIEAAFPERVTRDSEGRLVAIDARPINIERQKSANFSSRLTLRLGGTKRRPGSSTLISRSDRLQVNLALGYQLRLRNDSLIRRGLPVIDNLAGSGASRHQVDFRLGAGKRAFGGNLSASWNSPTRVARSDGAFRLTPPLIFNVSTFADVARLLRVPQANGWARGLKISFDIQNLFQGYRRVVLPDGSVPAGYSHDEVDPLGRTARLTLRKQF